MRECPLYVPFRAHASSILNTYHFSPLKYLKRTPHVPSTPRVNCIRYLTWFQDSSACLAEATCCSGNPPYRYPTHLFLTCLTMILYHKNSNLGNCLARYPTIFRILHQALIICRDGNIIRLSNYMRANATMGIRRKGPAAGIGPATALLAIMFLVVR